jgi:hypothetical protein
MDRASQMCGFHESAALQLQRRGVAVTAVRGYMDGSSPTLEAWEMCRYGRKSCLALSGWWRRRPRVSFTSLEALLRYRHLPCSLGVGCCLWAKASIRSWIGTMAAS